MPRQPQGHRTSLPDDTLAVTVFKHLIERRGWRGTLSDAEIRARLKAEYPRLPEATLARIVSPTFASRIPRFRLPPPPSQPIRPGVRRTPQRSRRSWDADAVYSLLRLLDDREPDRILKELLGLL